MLRNHVEVPEYMPDEEAAETALKSCRVILADPQDGDDFAFQVAVNAGYGGERLGPRQSLSALVAAELAAYCVDGDDNTAVLWTSPEGRATAEWLAKALEAEAARIRMHVLYRASEGWEKLDPL